MKYGRGVWVGAALFLCVALVRSSTASAAEVIWIHPVSDVLVTESPVSVIGYVAGATIDSLEVEVTGPDTGTPPRRVSLFLFKGRVFSGSVELSPGRNELQIGDSVLRLLYRPHFQGEQDGEFRKLHVHRGSITSCNPCHGFREGELFLKTQVPDLCSSCHELEEKEWADTDAVTGENEHTRSLTPDCGRCHVPHVSRFPNLLRSDEGSLCGSCHEAQAVDEAVHAASGDVECSSCHDPHFLSRPDGLLAGLPNLCQECHEQGAAKEGQVHPPIVRNPFCKRCHDPHGSTPGLLRAASSGLCTPCHSKVLEEGHGEELEECGSCHDPHGRLGTGLMGDEVASACAECHDDVGEGNTVHPALEEGCEACHDPHSEANVAQAKVSCPECHDVKGDSELASVHGELALPPQTCALCHPPHASDQEGLLRGKPHFPLTQGKCSACHGDGGKQGLTVVDVADRCRECHTFEEDLRARGAAIHDPVGEGECTTCHDPHMSDRSALMWAPQARVCRECHDLPETGEGVTLHEAAETCTECHNPHGGEGAKFLTNAPPDLCFDCHDDPREGEGELHPALEEGCLFCHDPHGGSVPGILKAIQSELCLECHDDPAAESANRHGALDSGCSRCHEPHTAAREHFLRAEASSLCTRCHEVARSGGGIGVHPPAEECTDCHEAVSHGGENRKFLTIAPPELCFECHDDPREGEGELHPALEEGCLVCHDPHAGFEPGFLRGESAREACLECHDDPLAGKSVIHEAVTEGCPTCHRPHTSEYAHFLKNEGNDLCFACHDAASHQHTLDAESGTVKFPASARFPRSGNEYACVGCHTPHAARVQKLYARPETELCVACHEL